MIYASYDHPELIQDLLDLIADWNRSRMELVLSSGVDLYIKRAWYENCDFWSPKTWKKFIFPVLKADAELAHQNNSLFGYLITANVMPLLDMIIESGVDVLIGIDPARWDLTQTKSKAAGKVCLWGGVNGHLTVEQGVVQDVEQEVRTAMDILAPGSGFILSPVDNVRLNTTRSDENVKALISCWQRYRE
jgi:uroporphyrinogen-III decarboxylase